MVVRILFIAHGATAATRAASFPLDEPLEPTTLDDARELGRSWAQNTARSRAGDGGWPLNPERSTIRTGPENRCRQTAFQLGVGGAAHSDPGLRDWDAGAWAGRSLEDVASTEPGAVQQWLTDPDLASEGGESRRELLQRIGSWLDGNGASSRVIAVTHPAVIRAAAVHALAAGPEAFWRIDVPPLTTLSVVGDPGRWSIRLR